MRERIVLIGAGSAVFTRGLVADLIATGQSLDLALVDIDPAALEVAERLARKMVAARGAPITVSAATERRAALGGATAVICTIGVGGRRAWEQDVLVPRQHGIFQPVGDSVMPGGTSRALRMIPAMVAIAEDVLDLAPTALFFNYGNPMAPVCRAVLRATGAKMVGLCHGVFQVAAYLAEKLGIRPDQMAYNAVGMNHLTWFLSVRTAGIDALPRLRSIGRQILADVLGPDDAPGNSGASDPADRTPKQDIPGANPFSWQLLELFGAFPAVLDRHVTEFFPALFPAGEYFGLTLGVDAFSFEDTIASGDGTFEHMREIAFSASPLPPSYLDHRSGEHEQVVDIIDSIRRDAGGIYSVNLPNSGQVPNLPSGAIVEASAIADGDGLRAITQEPLPSGIVGTLATRLAWVETTVEAALECSPQKFAQALLLDGAVASIEMARALAGDLLAAQVDYLPQFAE